MKSFDFYKVSAATENLLLAVHAMGLGGVWTACWPEAPKDKYKAGKIHYNRWKRVY